MDYLGSFHPPRMPSKEFEKMKAAYNAKHGYTIQVPSYEDIVVLKREPTLTPQEEKDWKKKDYFKFSELRQWEIWQMKARRKQKFLQMLGSPSPHYIRAAGSIMCALDDAQDCLSTIGVGLAIAGTAVPSPITPVLTAAAGFMLTTGAILDAAGFVIGLASGARLPKRNLKGLTDQNPFSKKAKLKRMLKIKKAIPSMGDALQAGQVSRDVVGVGLCLGPIIGFAQDFVSGTIRGAFGAKINYKAMPPPIQHQEIQAFRAMKSALIAAQETGYRSLDSDMPTYFATNMASQIAGSYCAEWNPAEQVINLGGIQAEAPRPVNILTLECFEEEGLDVNNHIAWPNVGKRWATYNDIYLAENEPATKGFNDFCVREKNSQVGWLGAQCATQSLFQCLGNIEGDDAVEFDFIAAERGMTRLLDAGLTFPPLYYEKYRSELVAYFNDHDKAGSCPTARAIQRYCKKVLKFDLKRIPQYANG